MTWIQRNRTTFLLLVVLMMTTLALRAWQLNHIPPGIFYDEAGQGLDARELLHGQFRVFFPRSMGKEPLYIYLTTPFVAVWDGQPFAVRLAGALLGTLTVLALYLAARALWRRTPRDATWVGLFAAALWTANYWPQSINRLGFRVNTLPLVLTLAVVAWLNWTHKPTRGRAFAFGLLAGTTLLTYLAARVTLLLWPLLYVLTLSAEERRRLAPTRAWALIPLLLVPAPMFIFLATHPTQAVDRLTYFPLWQGMDHLGDMMRLLATSTRDVLGGFLGWAGDPIPRHNLPGRPPFGLVLGGLFAMGAILAAQAAWTRPTPVENAAVSGDEEARIGRTLLLWWGVMLIPAILAGEDNPHFLRLFGALPPAFLLLSWSILWLRDRLSPARRAGLPMLLAIFLILHGAQTTRDYFITWAQKTDLYQWFQLDMWTIGQTVSSTPNSIGVVPLNLYYPESIPEYTLEYAFPHTPILRMRVFEDSVEEWLQEHLGNAGGKNIVLVQWTQGVHVNSDPKGILPMYLQREGTLIGRRSFRKFDALTYTLGPKPTFTAPGLRATPRARFRQGITLVDARWGAAYPNPTRSEPAAAGTRIWAVLTWHLDRPLPDVKVTLDLVDASGHRLASDERLLMDAERRPTSEWQPDTSARSYHILTVPVTQLPGPLYLESRVYDARTLVPIPPVNATPRGSARWGKERVTWAEEYPRPEMLDIPRRLDVDAGEGLHLVGADALPDTLAPGQTLSLRLYWHARQPTTAQDIRVALGETDVHARFSLPTLPAGAVIHTIMDMNLPPDLPAGTYTVTIHLPNGMVFPLGALKVAGRPRLFTAPTLEREVRGTFAGLVELLGVTDVAREGNTLTFTLVWKVTGRTERNLVRFVHLAQADGKPRSQEDTIPCRGRCPAPSWVDGEILLDPVRLSLPAQGPEPGDRLVVGWYDQATLQRLPARDVNGRPLPDNVIPLPLELQP